MDSIRALFQLRDRKSSLCEGTDGRFDRTAAKVLVNTLVERTAVYDERFAEGFNRPVDVILAVAKVDH